jgi:hypothetical protein
MASYFLDTERGLSSLRTITPRNTLGDTVCRKTRSWVAQRFQRCDKAFFLPRALALEAAEPSFSAPLYLQAAAA